MQCFTYYVLQSQRRIQSATNPEFVAEITELTTMGRSRSRSRSPKRRVERRRSRSPSPYSRDRGPEKRRRFQERRPSRSRSRTPPRRYNRRSRSRSRSPRRRRSRTPSPRRRRRSESPERPQTSKRSHSRDERPEIDEKKLEDMTEDEIQMMKVMGFAAFDTTKGKHVEGSSNAFAANIQTKRKYRQYMNRRGGFNRPLDFIA